MQKGLRTFHDFCMFSYHPAPRKIFSAHVMYSPTCDPLQQSPASPVYTHISLRPCAQVGSRG